MQTWIIMYQAATAIVKFRVSMSTAMGTWLIISYVEENQKKYKFFFLILDAESIILFMDKRSLSLQR